MSRKQEFVVSIKDHQSRIDDFAYHHHITKKALKAIKMKGDILVDGIHRTVRYVLQVGEVVTFCFPPEDNQIAPENIPLKIVYEDDVLLVIDKPSGMPCIPTRAHQCHTLANALSGYYQQQHLTSTIHIVNRLDKETSGLMIVAKYSDIHQRLCHDISHIFRVYRCHVEGHVKKQGTIDLPIYKDGFQMKRCIDSRGQRAITHYRCLSQTEKTSYIECRLETGRTHQIRVHMSAINHALVGDTLYGHEGIFDLESYKICFQHPISRRWIYIQKKTKKE